MNRFDGGRFAFAACGEDVTIYEWVRVIRAESIRVADHVIIDDFAFLDGGRGLRVGSHVHIAGYVSIGGGGTCEVDDFAGLAAGTRLVTGTDIMDGSGLTGPTIPADMRAVRRGSIRIGRHAVMGTNVVVHPNVEVGDGTIVGSGSLVTRDLPPWTICIGTPAKPVKNRPSERILELERELLARESAARR